jgi:hypothetical protein
MGTLWTVLTILLAAWLCILAIASLVGGSQPRTVRLLRDGSAVVLPIAGFLGFALITDTLPPLLPAVGAIAAGMALGYIASWRSGSLPAFGRAIVWSSPWHMTLLALSGAVSSVGVLGGWEPVITAGLLGLCAALGFGAGAFVFAVAAARDAHAWFEADIATTVTCPTCLQEVPSGTWHCTQCGTALPVHCSYCGSILRQAGEACEACGTLNGVRLPDPGPDAEEVTFRFCQSCSIRVSMDDMFCPSCGSLLAPACPLCGAPVMLDAEACALCDIDLRDAATAAESGLLDALLAEVDDEFRVATEADASRTQ